MANGSGSGLLSAIKAWHDLGTTEAGDAYFIDPGVYVWTNADGTTLTKGVRVIGSGSGGASPSAITDTIIEEGIGIGGNGALLRVEIPANQVFEFSHCHMRPGDPAPAEGDAGRNFTFADLGDINIHHCYMQMTHGPGIDIRGSVWGVIHNCTFRVTSGTTIQFFNGNTLKDGSGRQSNGDDVWTEDVNFGGGDAVYVEDCVFQNADGEVNNQNVTDSYGGARFVVRGCIFEGCHCSSHGTGDGSGSSRGPRKFEYYDNIFRDSLGIDTSQLPHRSRGGPSIYYNNVFEDYIGKSIVLSYYRIRSPHGRHQPFPTFGIDQFASIATGVTTAASAKDTLVDSGASWTPDDYIDEAFHAEIPASYRTTDLAIIDSVDTGTGQITTQTNHGMTTGDHIRARECQANTFVTRADVSSDLDATYFEIYDKAGSVGVWFDVDDTGTTIPAGASALNRAIEINTIIENDSAANVATKIAAALTADSKFNAVADGTTVVIGNLDNDGGGVYGDGNAGDTGFTGFVTTSGGTLPVGMAEDTSYWVNVVSPTVITLDVDPAGTALVMTGAQIGKTVLEGLGFYLNDAMNRWDYLPSPIADNDGTSLTGEPGQQSVWSLHKWYAAGMAYEIFEVILGLDMPGAGKCAAVPATYDWNGNSSDSQIWVTEEFVPNLTTPDQLDITNPPDETDHPFSDGEPVQFTTTGTLPTSTPQIVVGQDYYVRNRTSTTIEVSETTDGPIITFSDAGTGVHQVTLMFNQGIDGVYFWGNTYPVGGEPVADPGVKFDKHAFLETAGYDGSTGMGVGLKSMRPVAPSLIHTAYYAEDEGILYQWDGSAWNVHWQKYQYPHPLAQPGMGRDRAPKCIRRDMLLND